MPIKSWWQLGESAGLPGTSLSLSMIECAFCGERGNFERAFHAEKKKPLSDKRLNFDVYRCINCAGYVHVLWSASEGAFMDRGLHDFRAMPRPLKSKPSPSGNLSTEMARFWTQAHQSLAAEAWDAASVMARSALQLALREQGAAGNRLRDQIDDLGAKGLLPPALRDWATEVRLLGNDAAHPNPGQEQPHPDDVRQCVNFLDFLLYCLYDLPAEVARQRARRNRDEI